MHTRCIQKKRRKRDVKEKKKRKKKVVKTGENKGKEREKKEGKLLRGIKTSTLALLDTERERGTNESAKRCCRSGRKGKRTGDLHATRISLAH